MKKNKNPQPPRPPVPAPHEVLGIFNEGEQASCILIVADAKVVGASAKGSTLKIGCHVWGDYGVTLSFLELLRPSEGWSEFVAAMTIGAPSDLDLDLLITRSCAATGTLVAWQPGRPWTVFSNFTASSTVATPAHHERGA